MFDVLEIYKKLACWCPIIWPIHKLGLHPLFLRPKLKWKASNKLWFIFIPIGCNQFCLIVNKLIFDFLDLCEKILLNKTSQGVGITRMEEGTRTLRVWYGSNRPQGVFCMASKLVNLFLVLKFIFYFWFFVFEFV
jgi:hypothetical protein